jgi:hypothetical protein
MTLTYRLDKDQFHLTEHLEGRHIWFSSITVAKASNH